jgi:7,8-dihydroneopterin aldolase/epimerase/oxygenase
MGDLDKIFIRGLRLEAMIGIYRRERTTRQPVEIDLDIALPSAQVFASHKVADTIDYAAVARRLGEELERQRFGLAEELAEHIARLVLEDFRAPWVRVSVAKIGILKEARSVGVVIERERRAAS